MSAYLASMLNTTKKKKEKGKEIILNLYCLQETQSNYKDINRVKVNGWRKIYYANIDQQKAVVATLILDSRLKSKTINQRKREVIYNYKGVNFPRKPTSKSLTA
jgi:hypothetical protein